MSNLKKLVVTAMLIALCVVLPMAFHTIPRAGSILLPMHIPVLLAGLICGWKFGLLAGVAGPLLSSSLTGMPPTAIAPVMMIELGIYGLVAGVVMHFVRTHRASFDLYISMISAMIVGRVVAGIAQYVYFFGSPGFFGGVYENVPNPAGEYAYIFNEYLGAYEYVIYEVAVRVSNYTWALWTTSYFITSLPGIVIQLAFVPSVVMALERERVIPLRYPIRYPI
ncbi:MAG: ECF transporter S component [Defluviitaleaceae bacterium]|nr:ECF transporter S component [Defluviitaleaceae bacterium]